MIVWEISVNVCIDNRLYVQIIIKVISIVSRETSGFHNDNNISDLFWGHLVGWRQRGENCTTGF